MSAVTSTGLEEMRAACHQLPAAETAALRGVAQATATRMLAHARELLRGQLKSDRTALIEALVLEEDAANQAFRVVSKPPAGQPQMLPVWIEYGTVKMPARPYMHPSAEGEIDRYRRDMEAASIEAVAKVLG